MTWIPDNNCKHKNKKVTDCENMDGEVYYDCPDCGAGWRQTPETEKDIKDSFEFLDMDARALGLSKEVESYKKQRIKSFKKINKKIW